MKNCNEFIQKAFVLLIGLLLVSQLSAQLPCVSPTLAAGAVGSSQPINCGDFLKDFVPDSTEPTLVLNLKIWVFYPSTADSGVWAQSNSNSVSWLTFKMNSAMSSLSPPWMSIGSPFVKNSKINYNIKQFSFVKDSACYYDLNNVGNNYFDPHAINIYYGLYNPGYASFAWAESPSLTPPYQLARKVFMSTGSSGMNVAFTWDNLIHELGHALGLFSHSSDFEGYAYIRPTFGCCDSIPANDVYLEPTGIWGNPADCEVNPVPPNPVPPNASNNIMAYNWQCRRYLSPLQIAIMHYYLRTDLFDALTSQSHIDATTADTSFNYTVSGTETWTTPRFFKGNIIVPPGANLIIKCQVAMQNQGKIIIKRGPNVPNSAKVTIDGGKVTNISGRLWEGFDVEGNPSAPQSGLNSWTNHGQLWLINGGTIENSINGARNYGYNPDGSKNLNSTGGIIYASGGRFINNVRDVEFHPHSNDHSSFSQFHDCEFKTTGKINDNNGPYVHVSLCGVKGVKFRGCVFENAAQNLYPNGGQGVHSIDATYSFESSSSKTCYFKGFNQGISVGNYHPLWAINVSDAQFNDNKIGIELSSMQSAMITGNSFTLVTDSAKGIALNKCELYSVSSNTFIGIGSWQGKGRVGVYVTNSGQGAHRIYRNDFRNLKSGIIPQFDNSGPNNITDGLFMNCNVFTGAANYKDIAMMGFGSQFIPTVAKDQGVLTLPIPNPKRLVRNQYGAACYTSAHAKWYVYYSSTKVIDHVNNSDAVTTITPQPNCSTPNALIALSSNIALDFNNHCTSNGARPIINPSCPCPNCCRYTDISHGVSAALAITNTLSSYVLSTIDGGNTQDLLDTINAGTLSSGQLKYLLLPLSPYLSDTVLKAFLDKADAVAGAPGVIAADVIEVHDQNKPFSPAVWELATQLGYNDDLATQQEAQPISARESLEGELNLSRADLQFLYSEKINYFLHDTLQGAQDSVIRLLAENLGGIPHTVPRLVNAYAMGGYYNRAFAYADSLSADPSYTELMAIEIAKMQLDTSAKSFRKLLDNASLMGFFENYANDSTKAGSMSARAVLHEVTGRPMNFVYLLPEEEETEERRGNLQEENPVPAKTKSQQGLTEKGHSFKIYPNPAKESFYMLYQGPGSVTYRVVDIVGREYISDVIDPGHIQEISSGSLANGIYFITLIQANKVLEKSKLVIMK